MTSVSVFDAKTNLSKYITSIVNKEESSVVIMKNGKPVVRIIPYEADYKSRIGLGKGEIPTMPDINEFNDFNLEDVFVNNGGLI